MNRTDTKAAQMADLFCGAGGTSTGLLAAMKRLKRTVNLVAINHWDVAIATHAKNHAGVKHKNSNLEKVDPREIVPGGKLDFLWASPECTFYSRARGGKPVNNQSRATPKWIVKWCTVLDVQKFGLENVPEFRDWGPCYRCTCGSKTPNDLSSHKEGYSCLQPIPSRKGQFFRAFIKKLESLGYHIEYRVLCAADYGIPQERNRLFIIGSKDGVVHWPEPTHHKPGGDLRGRKKMWRTAWDDVIDHSLVGESIFNREERGLKPLSPNTMKRIIAGLEKFGGMKFMMSNQSGSQPRLLTNPTPTLTANGSISMFEPFIVALDQGGRVRSSKRPLHTVTSAEANAIVQPFIVEYHGNGRPHSLKKPILTVTGNDRFGLVQPIVMDEQGNKYLLDVRYRMFTSKEYAAAQGFPKGYKFVGTKKEITKQIGNAVPPGMAEAITYANMKGV